MNGNESEVNIIEGTRKRMFYSVEYLVKQTRVESCQYDATFSGAIC